MEKSQQNKRNLRNRTRKFYHECDEDMESRRFYHIEGKLSDSKFQVSQHVIAMQGSEFNVKYLQQNGWDYPILLKSSEGTGLKVPPRTFTVNDVQHYIGTKRIIDVLDVNSQKGTEMTMTQWVKYYNSIPRKKILNVISLEFSHSKLDELVESPTIVRDIDWVDNVWPDELKTKQTSTTNNMEDMKYPKVKKYVLMSVAGCYTDFHIDFGGTSVWYHILRGSKIFWLIPPTDENLEIYQQWVLSGKQQETFLGDLVSDCSRICLNEGDTFMIPTAWIHAVYTPTDALVFGGNFLHSYNIAKQLQVHAIEDRTEVPNKFRYPFFGQIHWYAAKRYLDILESYKHETCYNNLEQEPIPNTTNVVASDVQYPYVNKKIASLPFPTNSGSASPFPRDYQHEENHIIPQRTYQQQPGQAVQPQTSSMQQAVPQSLPPYLRNSDLHAYNQFHESSLSNWNQQYSYPVDYRSDNYSISDRDQQFGNFTPIVRSPLSQDLYYNQQVVDQNQFTFNQNYNNFQFGYSFQPAALSQPSHPNDSLYVQPGINNVTHHDQYEGQSLKRKADSSWEDWGKDPELFDGYLNPTTPILAEPYFNPTNTVLIDNNHVTKNSIRNSESKLTSRLRLPAVVYDGLTCLANNLEKNVQFHQATPEVVENPFQLIQDLNSTLQEHCDDDQSLAITGISILNPNLREMLVKYYNSMVTPEHESYIITDTKPTIDYGNESHNATKPSLRRRTRCRKCEACIRDDCSSCRTCKDMKKFGGPGRMKQSCLLRVCISPVLPINTKCDICNGGPSTALMECAICAQIVHPSCIGNRDDGVISNTIPNRWRCPNCLNSDQINLDNQALEINLGDCDIMNHV